MHVPWAQAEVAAVIAEAVVLRRRGVKPPVLKLVEVTCSFQPAPDPRRSFTLRLNASLGCWSVPLSVALTDGASVADIERSPGRMLAVAVTSAADTGLGDFTVTPTLRVSVPANAYAGAYTSVMTMTVSSGPA